MNSQKTEEQLWVICPVCHKPNPAGSHFCQNCWGAAIHSTDALTDEELAEAMRLREKYVKRGKKIKLAVIGAGALAIIGVVLLTLFYFTDLIVKPSQGINSNSLPGDWAMFHRDLTHTGNSGDIAPQGTLKWAYQTGAPVNSSPAVSNGIVYIGSQDSKLYALDAESGSTRWEYLTGSWVDSLPSVANGVVYFGSNDGKLYALNAQNGQTVWEYKGTFPVRSAPAIAGNMLYFGSDDYYLYALDLKSGKKVWDYDTGSPAQSPVAVANGIVYIGAADGYTYAFNAMNGQRRLRFKTHYAVYGGPAVVDSTVYVITTNGRLSAFDGLVRTRLQEHEMKPLWTQLALMLPGMVPTPPQQSGYIFTTDLRAGASNTSPVVSGDTLYVGLENKLVAVDLKTLKIIWSFATDGIIRSTPSIVGNTILVGSGDGNLYAVDAAKGEKLWEFATGGAITGSPAVANGVVYFGSADGKVYAIK